MPKVVKEFPQAHKHGKYADYLDGQVWLFTLADAKLLGVKHLGTVRNGIGQAARARNLKLSTSLKDNKLFVQATNGDHK